MGYFVYILYSAKYNRSYTGQTNNLQNRSSCHNSGKVRSTKAYTPWEMIYSEECNSRAEAMRKEKWYKSSRGRKQVKMLLEEYLSKQVSS